MIIKKYKGSLLIFLFAVSLIVLGNIRFFDQPLETGAPVLTGLSATEQGRYVALASATEHMYAAWISIQSNCYYRIGFDIPAVAETPVRIAADLYNVGYDNPEQERFFQLSSSANGKRFEFVINSEQSPPTAVLRFFYIGPAGLELANPLVARVPAWIVWSTPIGVLLIALLAAGHALRLLSRAIQREKVQLSGRSSFVVLWAIYLLLTVVHLVIYQFTPFGGGDEYVYKSIANGIWSFGRYGVLTHEMVGQSVDFPNLLYPWLISPAFAAGADFYNAIRIINALVMTSIVFPTYWIAREILCSRWALFVAALAAALPFTNLGAFAVTEVLFYPLSMVAFCLTYQAIRLGQWRIYLWCGVLIGVLLNIRLNAMVLLPVLITGQLWLDAGHGQIQMFFKRPIWLIAVLSTLLAYVAVQWLTEVMHVGGLGFYNYSEQTATGQTIVLPPRLVLRLLAGHVTTLALQYALPLALLCVAVVKRPKPAQTPDKLDVFFVLTLLTLLAFAALSVLFTIKISDFDLGGLRRWHSRYYFYVYPQVILAGLVCLQMPMTRARSAWVAVLVLGQLLVSSVFLLRLTPDDRWFGYIADNADMSWYRVFGFWAVVAGGLGAALLVLWVRRSKCVLAFFTLLLCIQVGVANAGWLKMVNFGQTHREESCGAWVDSFLHQHPGRYMVFADDRTTLVDVTFWLSSLPEYVSIIPLGQYIPSELPARSARYVVINGQVPAPASWVPVSVLGQCRIYPVLR